MLAKRAYLIVGASFLFIGAVLFVNSVSAGVTGFAVFGESDIAVGGVAAVWFLIAGAVVLGMSRRGENEAEELLDKRKILTKGDELKRLASRMGYELREGGNHTTIYNGKHEVITQIPRHSDVRKGTARSIMNKLRDNYAA